MLLQGIESNYSRSQNLSVLPNTLYLQTFYSAYWPTLLYTCEALLHVDNLIYIRPFGCHRAHALGLLTNRNLFLCNMSMSVADKGLLPLAVQLNSIAVPLARLHL